MNDKRIAGLIVAAGMSSRMKAFKPLLEIGGKTLIEHAVDTFREGGVEEIVIVTGNRAEEIEKKLSDRKVHFIRNEFFATTSMFESVKLGLQYIKNRYDEFFFLPGDIPLFNAHSLQAMRKKMDSSQCCVVQPMYKEKHGHPVLFSVNCIPHFLSYEGTNGLKGAVESLSGNKIDIALPDRGILMDTDTPEDFEKLKSYYSNKNIPSEELCYEILKYFKTDSWTIEHCKAVLKTAREISLKLIESGYPINLRLVEAASLLHDVARREKKHAHCGAQWLRELGYFEVADVVEVHMDLPEDTVNSIDEKSVVYLADKLNIEDKRVSLKERFERTEERFGDDKEAMESISIRLSNANKVLQNIQQIIGGTMAYENSISL